MKVMTILITLIIVILLVTVAVIIVKGFPTDIGGEESTLIQLCAVWKDEYSCADDPYLQDKISNLRSLCYNKFPDSGAETEVNSHCKKMCAKNNCNPMVIE